eukprot:TRINITY_DN23061_c0_g1_i2.p1 TRINITY_DN23061_c0_g1~~TRINITY_DN23061_c0_g1_i2.p1  ORF type:complete len:676 (+),score=151.05 TRINITY_DN23061_c0_g1_i2:46-2073(+)
MHGLLHVILKDLVVSKFGAEQWSSICRELDVCDDSSILDSSKQYDDETTIAAGNAVCKVLGVTWDDALRVWGSHFVAFVHKGGHWRMLESMGSDLPELLQNLNTIHYNLERSMRSCKFPYFQTGPGEGDSLTFSYMSSRGEALAALLEGVLPELAARLFMQKLSMQRLAVPQDGYNATWTLTMQHLAEPEEAPEATGLAEAVVARAGASWHDALVSMCCAGDQRTDGAPHKSESEVNVSPSETAATDEVSPMSQQWTEPLAAARDEELDKLETLARTSSDPAGSLMRGVPCSYVCADWGDTERLKSTAEFWRTNVGDARHFAWAKPSERVLRFVSHSWNPPPNWHEMMGIACDYGEMKATQLKLVAMDIAEAENVELEDVTFWVDKCCIPQHHTLMPTCVSLIEEFLHRCDGMVVLLTWQYFEKLWCMYEWASFLVYHEPQDIHICADAFYRPATVSLYIESIKSFAVNSAKCEDERDRRMLQNKVNQYYTSIEDFELFARCTAIALVAASTCRRSSRGQQHYETEFLPWVKLAEELGFTQVAEALLKARPQEWRRTAMQSSFFGGLESRSWQQRFTALQDEWFYAEVVPVLEVFKARAVKRDIISVMSMKKLKTLKSQGDITASTQVSPGSSNSNRLATGTRPVLLGHEGQVAGAPRKAQPDVVKASCTACTIC